MSFNDLLGRPWAVGPPSPPPTPAPAPKPLQPAAAAPSAAVPNPPPVDDDETLTVDDAWALFGIPQKRSTKDEVKRRYIALVAKVHPDSRPPEERVEATAQLKRANAAWALLQRYCKW